MGYDPAKYGLEVETEDLEGADYKETQKAQRNLTNAIDQAYQGQFGKKNNAVQVAKDAETRAYSTINTAKEAFVRNHGDVNFIPDNLGLRPNFMAPEYKDNLTKYVSDLNAWGNKVAEQFRNADAMTNEQLAGLIMQNDDENTAFNAGVTVATGEAVMENDNANFAALEKEIQDGTATIIKQVQIEGNAARVTIKNAKGEVINAVRTAAGKIMSEVQFQGKNLQDAVTKEGEQTRQHVSDTADRIIDTLDPTSLRKCATWVKGKAKDAGLSVFEFIQANSGMAVGAILGLPAGVTGVTLGSVAGHLIFD